MVEIVTTKPAGTREVVRAVSDYVIVTYEEKQQWS